MTVFDNVIIAKTHAGQAQCIFFHLPDQPQGRGPHAGGNRGFAAGAGIVAAPRRFGHRPALRPPAASEIARALATEPKLLLLDEPAAGMNPQETLELADFIHEIRDKHHLTILLIEHHMDLVMNISDRIYVLDFGSLIAQGLPSEIQKNQHVIDAYLGVVEDE